MNDLEFFRRMRKLIGTRCRHLGKRCILLDVLAQEAQLVLRCEEGLPPIQTDQFGRALRRASETLQIQVFAEDGESLSEEALELLASFQAEAA